MAFSHFHLSPARPAHRLTARGAVLHRRIQRNAKGIGRDSGRA